VITDLTASELSEALSKKSVSSVEITTAYLNEIESRDSDMGCFLAVDPKGALEQAKNADALIASGGAHPLTGVPIAIKDNISTELLETTCASKMLKGYIPPFDATVVKLLKSAGMPILGKTNMDEFAMGTSTENSAFQVTRNPWDKSRCPGGSSGGSAAAIAAKLAPLSIGSDTGGSIRQPAALCGTVGFKPTYGRCSRYGLVAFASSLDQIGPLSRTVKDAAMLAEVITGNDPLDSSSLPNNPIKVVGIENVNLRGLKVAVPKEMMGEGISQGVRQTFKEAMARLQEEGAIVEEISLPMISYGVSTYYIIAPAEASSNLARFDGIRYGFRAEDKSHVRMVEKTRAQGFGHEVKARIMIGTYVLSAGYYDAYYIKAQTVRSKMTAEFLEAFKKYDVIASPTSPVVAFKLGELIDDPMALKLLDFCTIPANMGGFPSISINCGFSEGLPVGLQFTSKPQSDEDLLRNAYGAERSLPEAQKLPASVG